MKNLLAVAIVLSSVSAFATRARVTALGNSPHLVDVASSTPDQLLGLGDSLTIESGVTAVATPATANANKNAEGTLYKSFAGGKLGLVLGHQDSLVYSSRTAAATTITTIKGQQNPLQVSYAMKLSDLDFGAGLIYSNYNDKLNSVKESTTGVVVGASNSMFYGNLKLIAADKYETSSVTYKGKMNFELTGGYNLNDTLSAHADIVSSGFKTTSAGSDTNDVDSYFVSVKLVDAFKKDGNSFFYGAGLSNLSAKNSIGDGKETALNLPLIIGLEATATSWLTLRASVTQDVLLSNDKVEASGSTTTELNPGLNTTKYAAGASLVFNKVSIDGTLSNGAGNQSINGTDLLSTVGLTYNF